MAPWVGVSLALVGLLTATSVVGAPAAPTPTGADWWLPQDGTRFVFDAGDTIWTTEWSRPSLFTLLPARSPLLVHWSKVTKTSWEDAQYLRVSSQQQDAQGKVQATGEDLWTLDDTGARTIAESTSDTLELVWEPGRPDLPADLAVGATWSSAGTVDFRNPGGEWSSAPYRADYQASAPTDPQQQWRGCIVVAMELVVSDQSLPHERTWCPGTGLASADDGFSPWVPMDGPPRITPTRLPAFDWSRADQLEFISRPHSRPGAGSISLSLTSAPGVLPDGNLVAANQLAPDLLAIDPAEELPVIRWSARPGGDLTSAASFDDITVVTTSRRGVVGYGPQGQWLWEARLSDLTRVPPVRFGDLVVVVTLDGAVTGYDLVSGAERWRAGMGTEIRRAPLVAGDRLLVADAGGGLASFDPQGNEQWTIDAGQVSSLAVSDGPDPVVAVGRKDSYVVRAYSLSAGDQVWRARILQDAKDLISLGDHFVLRDDDQLLAIDAASGAQLWSQPLVSKVGIGQGDRILLLTATAVLLLDGQGRQLREWPHQLGDVMNSAGFLTIAGDKVLTFGPAGFAVGRTP
ncbi:MAG: PQQ-binding-like beta-propeller repeat protein [Propionicimonas sp.]